MASAAATGESPNKTVTGHPVQAITVPPTPNAVIRNPREPAPHPVYLHQLFRQNSRDTDMLRDDQSALVYRLIAAGLMLFLAVVAIVFMLWLVLRPRLLQLQIASLSVSPFTIADSTVYAACNASIFLGNPNKKLTAFYDNFEVLLHYKGDKLLLSDAEIPPFAQSGKSRTLLHTQLQINANLGKDAVKALKEDLDLGKVNIAFQIFTLIRLESKEWRTRSQWMSFECRDVILGFSASNASGDLLNPFKECLLALW